MIGFSKKNTALNITIAMQMKFLIMEIKNGTDSLKNNHWLIETYYCGMNEGPTFCDTSIIISMVYSPAVTQNSSHPLQHTFKLFSSQLFSSPNEETQLLVIINHHMIWNDCRTGRKSGSILTESKQSAQRSNQLVNENENTNSISEAQQSAEVSTWF